MEKKHKVGYKSVCLNIEPELYKQAKDYAATQERSFGGLVRALLKTVIKKMKGGAKDDTGI